MTKKEYCLENTAIAYYSGFGGLEVHGIEYGIEDYIYCKSGAWGSPSKYSYHKLKVYYNTNTPYCVLHGYRIPMNECIKY